MKKLLPLLVLPLLISCSKQEKETSSQTNKEEITVKPTRDDIVKTNVETFVADKLHDAESYEFVSLTLIDSVLYKDNIQYRRKQFADREKSEKTKRVISKIDSIEQALGNRVNNVASYTYHYKFRSNNPLGAKVMNDYLMQIAGPDDNYKVLNMAKDKDGLYLNPNDFPGYMDMIVKNM